MDGVKLKLSLLAVMALTVPAHAAPVFDSLAKADQPPAPISPIGALDQAPSHSEIGYGESGPSVAPTPTHPRRAPATQPATSVETHGSKQEISPLATPEPGSLGIFACSSLLLLRRRRR